MIKVPSVLIVDDDEVFSATLARMLSRRGLDVDTAASSETALKLATSQAYFAVLLDLRLAEQSGLELILPIRQLLPETRIIMLTGYSSIATAVEAVKRGADNYLPKPINSLAVLAALGLEQDEQQQAQSFETDLKQPSLERLKWEHIQQTLTKNNGNVSATARELGIHRRTLQRKLTKRPVIE